MRRRINSLNTSTMWTAHEKNEIKAALVPESMSPETSDVEENEEVAHGSQSEGEEQTPADKKLIVVTPLSWRSRRFVDVLQSLDRKWLRRCTERARVMMKKRRPAIGNPLTSPIPEGIPAWMKR